MGVTTLTSPIVTGPPAVHKIFTLSPFLAVMGVVGWRLGWLVMGVVGWLLGWLVMGMVGWRLAWLALKSHLGLN
jgi:hypothetical protein